jgi:Domain of unknown function (DUF4160)
MTPAIGTHSKIDHKADALLFQHLDQSSGERFLTASCHELLTELLFTSMIEERLKQDIERAESLEDLAISLERLLNSGCYVWVEPNGQRKLLFARVLVEKINGLKIHIYADEHSPPHFHVIAPNLKATFSILDCSHLKGPIDGKTRQLIVHWYGEARPSLIAFWNRTRPADCSVGPIREETQE